MDFSESNRLYELAAEDSLLADALLALYHKYTEKMHDYLIAMADRYGIVVEEDCFLRSTDSEINEQRNQRLKVMGLILRKKPEEYQRFLEFSHKLDEEYAEEKVQLAERNGVHLRLEEAKQLSMWTGVI